MCLYFVFACFYCKIWVKVLSTSSARTKINLFCANILLICILSLRVCSLLWCRTRLFRLDLLASTVRCVLITKIIFIFVQLFLSDCCSFTSRKLYLCLETFLRYFGSIWLRDFKVETTVNYHFRIKLHCSTSTVEIWLTFHKYSMGTTATTSWPR